MSDKKGTKDMKRVLGCIRRADERYNMIREGDKICVGVSGGKDSLLLLYGLKLYQRFCYRHFDVCGVMLDLGLTNQDLAPVAEFARSIDVPFDIIKTDIGDVVFNIRKESHPCALCAKLRRGALNDAAKERGCNLVALGHNRDDVIETFFMSLLYESRLNTFGPVTYLGRKDVTVIRPMVFLPEKQALSIATRLELPIRKPNCPAAGHTKREEMKDIIRYFTCGTIFACRRATCLILFPLRRRRAFAASVQTTQINQTITARMNNMDEKTLFIIIITYLGIMSLILFLMMGIDKAKAKQGARRISEKSLFTVAALGGGIGGVLGMKVFHHKTLHTSFKLGMPALTVLNFGIAFLIMRHSQR